MEITEVRIFPKEGLNNKLRAYATITIDDSFVVRNIKVIEGKSGLFVAMPSRKMKDPRPKCGHKKTEKKYSSFSAVVKAPAAKEPTKCKGCPNSGCPSFQG